MVEVFIVGSALVAMTGALIAVHRWARDRFAWWPQWRGPPARVTGEGHAPTALDPVRRPQDPPSPQDRARHDRRPHDPPAGGPPADDRPAMTGAADRPDRADRPAVASPALIAAAVVAHRGRVLLVKRRDRSEGLVWMFPSGRLTRPSETAAERAEAETRHETGAHVRVESEIGTRTHPRTGAEIHYFHCAFLGGDVHNAAPDENETVEWIDIRDLTRYIPDSFSSVRRYLEQLSERSALPSAD